MKDSKIKLYVVDDHPVVVEGIKLFLKDHFDIELVGHATTAELAKKAMINHDIDVVLLDIQLPGQDGIELARYLNSVYPRLNIIGLTTHTEVSLISAMLKAGAIAQISAMAIEEDIELTAPPPASETDDVEQSSSSDFSEDDLPPPPPATVAVKDDSVTDDDLAPPPPAEVTQQTDPRGILPAQDWSTEPVGTRLSKPKSGTAPQAPSTDHLDLSPPKSELEQLKHDVKKVQPNISHLEVANEGSPLTVHKKKQTTEVADLSHIELAEVGEDLGQTLEFKETVTPDISQLSLAEQTGNIPNLKQDKELVNPDTSHLTLK